jgi:hypothetical protein
MQTQLAPERRLFLGRAGQGGTEKEVLTAKSAMQAGALVVALAAIFLLGRYVVTGEYFGLNKEPFSVAMEREAARLNATLPEMVSSSVRLDKAAAGPGNSFNYRYTIVDADAAKNIVENANERDKLKAQLQERVCTVMPAYRKNGTIVNYSLRDIEGATIADISIDPKNC